MKIITKITFILFLLTGFIYLSGAINFNLSKGDKLGNSDWGDLTGISSKIGISSNDLNIDGKLNASGKICLSDNRCLGECNSGYHWDVLTSSCKINNCDSSTITLNSHNYSVPTLNDGDSVLVSASPISISGGTIVYSQIFNCNSGLIETSGTESSSISCSSGYVQSGNSCTLRTCTNYHPYGSNGFGANRTDTLSHTLSTCTNRARSLGQICEFSESRGRCICADSSGMYNTQTAGLSDWDDRSMIDCR